MHDDERTTHGSSFRGRVRELQQFQGLLKELLRARPADQPSWSHIALIYGLGGIGKTTLLDRFHKLVTGELTDRQYAGRVIAIWLDWESERERHPATFPSDQNPSLNAVLDALHGACQVEKGMAKNLRAYRELTGRQRAAFRKVEAASGQVSQTDARNRRWASASATVIRTLLQVGNFAGLPTPTLDKAGGKQLEEVLEVGAEGLSELKADAEAWLRSHLTTEEFELFARPNEALASSFARGVRATAARRPVIFFLDAYETIRRTDPWLRRVMAQCGPRVAWILSARFEADKLTPTGEVAAYLREVKPGERLRVMQMAGFSKEDVREYLVHIAPERPPSPADIDSIFSATRGIPLAVGAAAALWARGIHLATITSNLPTSADHSTLVQLMTARFLAHADVGGDPHHDIPRLLALSLVDHTEDDPELLGTMLGIDDPTRVLRALSDRHDFVFTTTLRLHPIVRSVFQDSLMDPLRRKDVQEANDRAIELLERRLSQLNRELRTLDRRAEDELWTTTVSALAWHRFWSPEGRKAGWATVAAALPAAIAYNPGLGQVLWGITRRFALGKNRGQEQLEALQYLLETQALPEATVLLRSFETMNGQRWVDDAIQPDEGCSAERSAIERWHLGVAAMARHDINDALRYLTSACDHATTAHQARALRGCIGEASQALADRLIWDDSGNLPTPSANGLQAAELATRADPHNIANWILLGQALLAAKSYTEALKAVSHAERLAPNDARVLHERGPIMAAAGHPDEALIALDSALRIDPGFARAHSNRGVVLAELGRFDEALQALDQAIEMDDGHPVTHCDRGVVLAHLGRPRDALIALDSALRIDPGFARAHSNRGVVLAELGRFDEALQALDQAIRLDPNNAAAYANRGAVLARLGRINEGLAALGQALALNPDDVRIYQDMGKARIEQGDLEAAEELFIKATELHPKVAFEAWAFLGLIAFSRNDSAATQDRLSQALSCYGRQAPAWGRFRTEELRSLALCALGRWDDAERAMRKALTARSVSDYVFLPAHRLLAHDPAAHRLTALVT